MEALSKLLENIGFSWMGEVGGIAELRYNTNGLKVLLVENHSAPVVTLMKVYRVGSRNEGAGNSGATHFLEHMMFKGTTQFNPSKGNGIDDQLKPIGAFYNATTWVDRTYYFECAGREHLETLLSIESDRMRNLVLRKEDRDAEMTVVRNEFERGENDPDDVLNKELWKNTFQEHPYHIPTIGWRSDVEGVPMERLKEFYDTFYWPNNCTLIVVGDFDPGETLRLIAQHFGSIPSSPKPIPEMYTVEPPQEGERRFKIRRAGDLPRVSLAFHVPQANHPDNYPLAVMAAILGGPRRSSRLYRRLVDTGLASQVNAHKYELRDPSLFELAAVLNPGVAPEEVEAALLDELSKLAAAPVSEDELRRAKSGNRKGTILSIADPMGYAKQIAEAEACADWRWLVGYDDNFESVTAADIQRVAGQYFSQDNRTVGYFLPKEEEQPPQKEEKGLESPVKQAGHAGQNPAPAPQSSPARRAQKASFATQVVRTVLPNGMVVLIMQNQGTQSLGVSGKTAAGAYYGPKDKTLVPALTSYLLSKGSQRYSKTQVGEILEEMGSHLGFASDNFGVKFGTLGTHVVATDLPAYMELMADLICHPLFLQEELDKSKKEYVAWIKQQMNDTGALAKSKLLDTLYGPDNIYHDRPFPELLQELEAITVEDLKAFHKEHYSPQGTILSLVGDIDPAATLELVKASFGQWTGPAAKPVDASRLVTASDRASKSTPLAAETFTVAMADKKNVDIIIGQAASLKRTSADFYAAQLANAALGQDTLASRLGLIVREKHGLTYGINSRFDDTAFGGAPWTITLSVNPANVEKALQLTREVVGTYVSEGITDKELSDEKGRAVGGFLVGLRTSFGIANVLTQYEFIGLGAKDMDSYADSIKAVTKEQVNQAIGKYFRLDQAVTVLAGTFA